MMHILPLDLKQALASNPKTQALWEDITPLARNEWICWVVSGKKAETRNIRIDKAISKLMGGMRRPCCWAGCQHRLGKEEGNADLKNTPARGRRISSKRDN